MGPYKTLKITTQKRLLIITLNRPEKKNAFNREMYLELTKALNEAAENNNILITAITGSGDFYSSGNDLNNFIEVLSADNVDEQARESSQMFENFINAFINFPKVLIAVVNGPCIGVAATTAAICDVIYASETAYFHTPFTSMALNPEGCSSYTFPRILGKSKANEMLLLNYKLTSEEAYKLGFVSELFSKNSLSNIWSKLEDLSLLPLQSVIESKKLIKRFEQEKLRIAHELETMTLNERKVSEEAITAVMNFMSRRKSKL